MVHIVLFCVLTKSLKKVMWNRLVLKVKFFMFKMVEVEDFKGHIYNMVESQLPLEPCILNSSDKEVKSKW